MKKVMPFVQFTKERIASTGLGVLELTLDFDEKTVLSDNMEYLLNNLQLEGMDLKFSEEAQNEKTQEECRPGAPYVTFRFVDIEKLQFFSNIQLYLPNNLII